MQVFSLPRHLIRKAQETSRLLNAHCLDPGAASSVPSMIYRPDPETHPPDRRLRTPMQRLRTSRCP